MKAKYISMLAIAALAFTACSDDDEEDNQPGPSLTIPSEYISPNYDANVVAEAQVIGELATMTGELNDAEANAQTNPVDAINYPTTLSNVTIPAYRNLIQEWLVELVASANSPDGFVNPGLGGTPAPGQEGGLLGTRLLDENGLELEQMIQKGSFGAACYNHALTVIYGDAALTADMIDKLVEIHGTDISFNASEASAAAQYSKRRSDNVNQTGFFYDIRTNLITAKAAIEAGSAFNSTRDEALENYLLNWEKSNFATVIYYCEATKNFLQEAASLTGEERENKLGDAMHAYAEGVGFTHGFRGLSQKLITDAEIDAILAKLLAPAGQVPESHRFINEALLIQNLDEIQEDIQSIYGFSNEEVTSFYVNN
jgi:hypothetical protein